MGIKKANGLAANVVRGLTATVVFLLRPLVFRQRQGAGASEEELSDKGAAFVRARPSVPQRVRSRRAAALGLAVAVATSVMAFFPVVPASAAPAGWACYATYSRSCITQFGYTGASTWGYPVDAWGNNCTNYAAFRLAQNGAANPGNLGNAVDWDTSVAAKFGADKVNQTPVVGAIAQWNTDDGHVAYVDWVSSDGNEIATSESAWNGTYPSASLRRVFTRGGASWPSNFLHIKDVASWPPAEGSFVNVTDDGSVYRIVGGAPIWVSTWTIFGGVQPYTNISQAQLNSLPAHPADGTYITGIQSGTVYRIAGGAPLAVSSWPHMGGGQLTIPVDQVSIDQAGGAGKLSHLNFYPSDTFLHALPSQRVFRVVNGGHPYYVSSWAPYGSPPYTDVDDWAIDNCNHLNCEPFGFLDSVTAVPGGAFVKGWAMDPNVETPINIHVYVDGASLLATTADQSRPDVDGAYHRGAMFGYGVKVPLSSGTHNVCTYAINVANGAGNPQLGCQSVTVEAGTFAPVTPTRLLDTRDGTGTTGAGAVSPGGTVSLKVAGRGGVPASGVSAVVLNVTEVAPTQAGNITVYPSDVAMPNVSNLNFGPGDVRPNLVTAKLGADGSVKLTNSSAGSTQLIADVSGYYLAGTPTAAGAFVSLAPQRILDTRFANGVPGTTPVSPNGTTVLQVTGRGGVPSANVSAVVLNVTEVGPTQAGNITVYPADVAMPNVSNLNFKAGDVRPNLVTVKVSSGGQVKLTNTSAGSTHLIADVAGYYLAGTPTAPGTFVAVTPSRLLDTRTALSGPMQPGGTMAVVPSVSGASAVVLNVTETGPTQAGNIVVYPGMTGKPNVSNLNFAPGDTYPNLVAVMLGADGRVNFTNSSAGTTHLIVDLAGYFKA